MFSEGRPSLSIWQVKDPRLVLKPSAMVIGGIWGCSTPFSILSLASLARQGSTPMGMHFPPKCLLERTEPLLSPPPPMGNTRQSSPSISQNISLATVACPVMISRSLQGWMKVELCSFITLLAVSYLSLRVLPDSIIVAPQPLTAFFLTMGEFSGITMQAGILRVEAAKASACAWLPDEWVHTDFTLLSICRTLLKAPLGLKAPTF